LKKLFERHNPKLCFTPRSIKLITFSQTFRAVSFCYRNKTIAKYVRESLKNIYRKISIDRPGGIHFLSTHNFWIIHKRPKIKTYSERMETFLSEYAYIFVLWQVVQKLCAEKKRIAPGLSIEILLYIPICPHELSKNVKMTNNFK
jgi:hypothetical protein